MEKAYPQILQFMAQRRLCADHVRPDPQFRLENGHVKADFAEFDRAAQQYFDRLKMPLAYTPQIFYLFGWGFPPGPHFGEHPYPGTPPYEGADRSKLILPQMLLGSGTTSATFGSPFASSGETLT